MAQHQLFIMRHGQAAAGEYGADFERALTLHGQMQVHAMGDWLSNSGMSPQHIIASAAYRARQTAELVGELLSPAPAMHIQAGLYQIEVNDLTTLIKKQPESCSSVMVVAHNPTLEDLLYNLLTSAPMAELKLKPGSLAVIEINAAWNELRPSNCSLSELIHANELISH